MRANNNKKLLTLALASTLAGCINLPAQNDAPPQHYSLLAAQGDCQANTRATIKLAVTRVASGLDSDRLIQISKHNGELRYLSNMRWPNNTQALLEQRLAQDLESAGFSIITSHQQLASTPQLYCELRSLNLLSQEQANNAVFALSCNLYQPEKKSQHSIAVNEQVALTSMNTHSISVALSNSYQLGFQQLCQRLNQQLSSQ
ncbi:ABC-type transport auxiliary lipoprotein family protein [Dasania sp. GY-MA-18]|uniref:ABC-type transport auxiliary lipoprotein family protein n=1 Tax=Dasania phycosphaerae TaxID=2950436 RepID=A0A9J6RHA3_9GAMM|nr:MULTISPECIES: ABC-type transport auxiliary lipoprotein family protein [Dasania]MCR8921302.1 ABC-type transport auxiliary lipoprotein family protein [Dasania sp. GY-MA-18]MCZ0863730.1 ABC-type transport auxiliary lipoprotein family protein [Dasania phycosphaerae]MCZ0867458.1 ABC-type transport auxiliary lipoprotein family protein [Dasania phycosphaerae]